MRSARDSSWDLTLASGSPYSLLPIRPLLVHPSVFVPTTSCMSRYSCGGRETLAQKAGP